MIKSKLTKRQRIAYAFREAKVRLQRNHNFYICIALNQSGCPNRVAARKEVQRRMRLSTHTPQTLEEWLRIQGFTEFLDEEVRQYRLRWLDVLIQEFDPEGVTDL